MRKTILAALICGVSVMAVACGGGNAAGNGNAPAGGGNAATAGGGGEAAKSDAFALYKKKGRTWLTKSTVKMEGMDPMVTYSKSEVVDVTDKSAKVKMWTLDKDQKPMAGMEAGTEMEIKFETPAATGDTTAKPAEPKKETVKVEAGEFECYMSENAGTKSWSSVEFPGLPVKMEGATMTMELVKFDK